MGFDQAGLCLDGVGDIGVICLEPVKKSQREGSRQMTPCPFGPWEAFRTRAVCLTSFGRNGAAPTARHRRPLVLASLEPRRVAGIRRRNFGKSKQKRLHSKPRKFWPEKFEWAGVICPQMTPTKIWTTTTPCRINKSMDPTKTYRCIHRRETSPSCDVELVAGVNISASRMKARHYRCDPHYNEYQRGYQRKSRADNREEYNAYHRDYNRKKK